MEIEGYSTSEMSNWLQLEPSYYFTTQENFGSQEYLLSTSADVSTERATAFLNSLYSINVESSHSRNDYHDQLELPLTPNNLSPTFSKTSEESSNLFAGHQGHNESVLSSLESPSVTSSSSYWAVSYDNLENYQQPQGYTLSSNDINDYQGNINNVHYPRTLLPLSTGSSAGTSSTYRDTTYISNNSNNIDQGNQKSLKRQSESRLSLPELYQRMGLGHDHDKAHIREQKILNILRQQGFKLGEMTWIRDTTAEMRAAIISEIYRQTYEEYGYSRALLEVIVRRGSYYMMQGRLRRIRRFKKAQMINQSRQAKQNQEKMRKAAAKALHTY